MNRVLIIAETSQKAVEGSALLPPGMDVGRMFPGSRGFPSHFDAAVVYCDDEEGFFKIKDEVDRYRDVPVRAFVGKEIARFAAEYHAATFSVE